MVTSNEVFGDGCASCVESLTRVNAGEVGGAGKYSAQCTVQKPDYSANANANANRELREKKVEDIPNT